MNNYTSTASQHFKRPPTREEEDNLDKPSTEAKTQSPPLGPPPQWEKIYSIVEELRQDRTAPIDSMIYRVLPDRTLSPPEYRFQVLFTLLVSRGAAREASAEAIRSMQRDKVLFVDALDAMPTLLLETYLTKVWYSKRKTGAIKEVVAILKEKYNGDIPPTAEEIVELPTVDALTASICENVAWNKSTGIWVNKTMHQLFNRLRWVNSDDRFQTSVQLAAWLPTEKWTDVSVLWTGFGEELYRFKPKILRKALDCSRPADALTLLKRFGLDYVKEGSKLGLEDEIKSAIQNSQ